MTYGKNWKNWNIGRNWEGLGVSGRTARTIRNFSLEVSPDLVLLDMGNVDFHDFWKYWKIASSQIASKMVPGDRQWSLDAPWVLLDPPKMKLGKNKFRKRKVNTWRILKFAKTRAAK